MLNDYVTATIKRINQELPGGVSVHTRTPTPVGVNEVCQAVEDLGEKRDWIMKTILAVYTSTFLEQKDPLWLILVGNPSSNKTTLVDLLKNDPNVYRLDTMTGNPFSSGQKESDKPKDLLPLLDGKCFVIKEYGTLFGKSDEMVKSLIGDLTAIYDGEYSKHSPTRGTIRYHSFFSHLGCVTPHALEGRKKYMSQVGARFLFLRIPKLKDLERNKALADLWANTPRKSKAEVREVVNNFLVHLSKRLEKQPNIHFSSSVQKILSNWAILIARARGIVISDSTTFETDSGKKTHYEVVDKQIEEPFRALKQIKKLAECLALVSDRLEVNEEDLDIVRRVVLSSMPVRRADILAAFADRSTYTAPQASEQLGKHYKTVKRNLDELVALEVLDSTKTENQKAREYTLRPSFQDIFRKKTDETLADSDYIKDLFFNETSES